jgi:hypothetical protein
VATVSEVDCLNLVALIAPERRIVPAGKGAVVDGNAGSGSPRGVIITGASAAFAESMNGHFTEFRQPASDRITPF